MARPSRDKGLRVEREIVALHAELGIKAERVPLSGAQRYQGNGCDIDVYINGPDAAPLAGCLGSDYGAARLACRFE
jgi:hypothetical protein